MTRKSGKHYMQQTKSLDSCFDLIRSHQQRTPWSPSLEIEPAEILTLSYLSTSRIRWYQKVVLFYFVFFFSNTVDLPRINCLCRRKIILTLKKPLLHYFFFLMVTTKMLSWNINLRSVTITNYKTSNWYKATSYPSRLFLYWEVRLCQQVSWYDIIQSDVKTKVMEIWGVWGTPSLPLLPDPL